MSMSLSRLRLKLLFFFQGLLHDLRDVFEAFILCLPLEIIPFFNSQNSRNVNVPTAVWKGEVGTRCYSLSLKHSLTSPTWKSGSFHTSHYVRTEGTLILHGLSASRAVCFCISPLVSSVNPDLVKETGLCWWLHMACVCVNHGGAYCVFSGQMS